MKRLLYKLGILPYEEGLQIKLVLKRIKHVLKNAIQLLERGFSDIDLYDLHSTFTDFILPRLIAFKQSNRFGTPTGLREEEWENILDSMIRAFKLLRLGEEISLTEEQRQDIKDGLYYFSEWYEHLWD